MHSKPVPRASRRQAGLAGAVLAAAAAVALAGFRIHAFLSHGPALLRLSDAVPLGPVPPLASDREVQRNRLLALERAWVEAQRSTSAALWTALGGMALQAGDPMGARAALERALSLDAGNPRALERLGRAEVSLGLFKDAASTWRALMAVDPGNAAGYIELSRTLTVTGRRSEAAAVLEKAERSLPGADTAAQAALIREYDRRGELAHALQLCQRLAGASPHDQSAQFLLAVLLFKTQRLDEARPLLEGLVSEGGREVQARRYLAAVLTNPLSKHRDARRAEHLLLEAASLDPADGGALLDLASLYAEQGRDRPAAYVLTRLLAIAPGSATARLQLAHAFQRLGVTQAAREQADLAQRLFSRNREAEKLRTQIGHRPADGAARLALGLHFVHWGEYGRALPELEAAFCLSGRSPKVCSALRTYFRELGLALPDYLRKAAP